MDLIQTIVWFIGTMLAAVIIYLIVYRYLENIKNKQGYVSHSKTINKILERLFFTHSLSYISLTFFAMSFGSVFAYAVLTLLNYPPSHSFINIESAIVWASFAILLIIFGPSSLRLIKYIEKKVNDIEKKSIKPI